MWWGVHYSILARDRLPLSVTPSAAGVHLCSRVLDMSLAVLSSCGFLYDHVGVLFVF